MSFWWTRRARRSRTGFRLHLEVLEERATPAQFTWTGAGGNALWSTPGNWKGNTAPNNTGGPADVIFPGTAALTTTNNLGTVTFGSITFTGSGYTIGGQALTVTGTITAGNAAATTDTIAVPITLSAVSTVYQSITVTNATAHLVLSGALTDPNGVGLIKLGSGALVLSGNNSAFVGPIDIKAGLLQAGSGNAIGNANTIVTVDSAGQFDVHDQSLAINTLAVTGGAATTGTGSGGVFTVHNIAMSGGTITVGAADSLVLTGNLTATSSAAGEAFINGGTVTLSNVAHTLTVPDGPTAVDLSVTGNITGAGAAATLAKSGAGRFELNGIGTYGTTTIDQGDFEVNPVGGQIGDVVLNGGSLSGSAGIGAVTGPGGAPAVGSVAPGSNEVPGQFAALSAVGDLTFGPLTTFAVDLSNGHSPGQPQQGIDYDWLDTLGNASLGGAILSGTSGAGIQIGDTFDILQTTGTLSGRFAQVSAGHATILNEGDSAVLGGLPYTIHYGPNDVFLTRSAAAVASVTTLASAANPAQTGQSVALTATVSSAVASSFTPTGTVVFSIDGASLPRVTLSGGRATLTTSALTAGLHQIDAVYSGDSRFAPSATTSSLQQTITSSPNGVVASSSFLGNVGTTPLSASEAIVVGTDVDVFAFAATAGQLVRFNTTHGAGSSLDSFLRLFDVAGTQLAFNDDGPTPNRPLSRDASLLYRFVQTGTYYVAVSGYPNYHYNAVDGAGVVSGSTGAYGLSVFVAPPDVDNNNLVRNAVSLGTATSVRQIQNYEISTPTDVDMFRFHVTAGQRITLAVTDIPGSVLIPYLRLFDGRGHQLAVSAPGGRQAVLTFTFEAAGTFYVGVSGRGNNAYSAVTGAGGRPGSTGIYTITLSPINRVVRHKAHTDAAPVRIVPSGTLVGGVVFFDQSGDGLQQSGDIGLPGHSVILDLNNNGVHDDGEPVGFSDGRGRFLLSGLVPVKSAVYAIPLSQFGVPVEKVTAPQAGFYLVRLNPRKQILNLVFGMTRYEA